MINNKQYTIILEYAKVLNLEYKLLLDFSSSLTDPISAGNSLWIGAIRNHNIDQKKFNDFINKISSKIINNNYKITVDKALNIWYGI